jgi:hypothetical protein
MSANADEGASLRQDSVPQLAAKLINSVDFENGGLSGAPKFPSPPVFRLFWLAFRKTGEPTYGQAVETLLDRMSEGGIYDHLGGGYARYSVDARWLVPHFEKMLYDNAQIVELLTWAWQQNREPLFERRIVETIGWLEREMIGENGAFAASQDADSEGEEGKFYLWDAREIRDLLGTNADEFARVYDVTDSGNFEGRNILNRLRLQQSLNESDEARLETSRKILFMARDTRVHPGWDDKVLADWNGLMIAALVQAGAALERPEWIALAENAFEAVVNDLARTGDDGTARLRHSFRQGSARHEGMLDDYANMARAALLLHETTGVADYLRHAQDWVRTLDRWFWDEKGGGYFLTAADAEALIVRSKHAMDNATPAGNGVMVEVLARLAFLTGDDTYRERAEALVIAFASAVGQQAPAHATLLCGFDLLMNADQVVLVGNRAAADFKEMLRSIHAASLPNKVLRTLSGEEVLPEGHPASGKGMVDGKATVYVCHGQTCSLPITDPATLRDLLNPEA